MPMQPRPSCETTRPCLPKDRFFITKIDNRGGGEIYSPGLMILVVVVVSERCLVGAGVFLVDGRADRGMVMLRSSRIHVDLESGRRNLMANSLLDAHCD